MDDSPMTVEQAAAFLGFSKHYIYQLVSKGKIPYYKPLKGRVYFKRGDLLGFIYRNRAAADYEIAEQADAVLNGEAPKEG
ncbi:MAG: helix-turn-helix domain-containing protein [Treponema sp.]|jgi:excisionase family DNA binding protein|nr:helix-turn-helix domain-containing protein [Treponema sp.]